MSDIMYWRKKAFYNLLLKKNDHLSFFAFYLHSGSCVSSVLKFQQQKNRVSLANIKMRSFYFVLQQFPTLTQSLSSEL